MVAQSIPEVPNNREVFGAFSLLETWRRLAAAGGSFLEVSRLNQATRWAVSDRPTRTVRGWSLAFADGAGVHVHGPRPIIVDLELPGTRELESEIERRQGPLTAMVMSVAGFTPIHAAGIQTPRGFIGLAAPSGTGKSTVASLAHAAGWPVAGDDVLAMAADLTVLPLPGSLRTDAPWMDQSSRRTGDGRKLLPLAPLPGPEKLRALVTLARGNGAGLDRVAGASRLAVVADAMLAGFLADREEQLLDFAAGIPVYRLTVPGDLAALQSCWPAICNLLVEACG